MLPKELIAQKPLADRSASRLLCLDRISGAVTHKRFTDVPHLLQKGDVMVVNETRVTAMRLYGHRAPSGGSIELLLLKRVATGSYESLARPAKRLKAGAKLVFENGLLGEVEGVLDGGRIQVRLWPEERLMAASVAPLPPYITEPLSDRERYQTIYARSDIQDGSAAAPTAGLHFTPELLAGIGEKGVKIVKVELQVGLDTFRPIQAENLDAHEMLGERCRLSKETAFAIAQATGRIIAVGTTTVRTLETFARLPGSDGRRLAPGETVSKLFLSPGSEFKVVDAMFTNFHMPRTTMLVMLAAFAGQREVMNAYASAIQERYRFLSFGDSMYIG